MVDQDQRQLPPPSESIDEDVEEQERQYNILKEKLLSVQTDHTTKNVDVILFFLHGIGSHPRVLSGDYRMVRYMINSMKKYWFYHQNFRIHLHMVDWKRHIIDAQNVLFEHTYITTTKETRRMITGHLLDIGFFLSPKYSGFLLENIVNELDGEVTCLRNHPSGIFKDSKIALIGYSMGSLILHEILCGKPGVPQNGQTQDSVRLKSKVDYLFTVGSPLSCFMLYQAPQLMSTGMILPVGVESYNVFHPYDPIAYRWERLIYRDVKDLPEPEILPHWKNNGFKNWYGWEKSVQQAKSMIVDNISDVASSISKSIFGWWGNNKSGSILVNNVSSSENSGFIMCHVYVAIGNTAFNSFKTKLRENTIGRRAAMAANLNKQNHASDAKTVENEGDAITNEVSAVQKTGVEETDKLQNEFPDDDTLAKESHNALHEMNREARKYLPRRYDYQLQEDITEHLLSPLGIVQSHLCYCSSKDLIFFILKTLIKKHEPISLTAYLNSIKMSAKRIADSSKNNQMKAKFLALAEEANAFADNFNNEDNKAKADAASFSSGGWTTLKKPKDDDINEADLLFSDPIEAG
ncbi:hypothetical protein BgAZ_200230 [Babesia gibsoni]|uniref:DDHD domain-containing protein n=1 Tax=Babesia gibsoni TaxID=33632 RepID=A0AAD8PE35_BABGI|nr:hypothetical protein BgAZ_200230 [Babesia gibsoni]